VRLRDAFALRDAARRDAARQGGLMSKSPDAPRDSSRPDAAWARFRGRLWDDPALGIRLDVSRMPIDEVMLDPMRAPLARAFEAMRRLEAGGIANPDEGRPVGHYWLRDPDRAPDAQRAEAIRSAIAMVKAFAADVIAGRERSPGGPFRHFLLIGIGGSALGPQLLADALGGLGKPGTPGPGAAPAPSGPVGAALAPHFLDNTDPDGIERVLARLGPELPQTLVLVMSKSGGTKETRNGMLEVERALARLGLPLGPQAVAVTMPGSALDAFARAQGFRCVVPIWEWVGGRTSITSAVGLLPAALMGIDIDELLAGACAMDQCTREATVERNPAALMALAWHAAGGGRGGRDLVVLPYRDRLALLGRYLQQLVMESLGKERDRGGRVVHQGLTVYGNKGSTDQHAFVQQLREGPDDFFVTFVHVLRDGGAGARGTDAAHEGSTEPFFVEPGVTMGDYLLGFLLGTREALTEKGRGSMLITLAQLGPRQLGALLALFERAVGLYAELVDVNAYHQPGVEAGKLAATRVLELQRALLALLERAPDRAYSADAAAASLLTEAEAGAAPSIETIHHILEHLAANGRIRAERERECCETRYRARP
jgi:glucose-6-phosphate isomerase